MKWTKSRCISDLSILINCQIRSLYELPLPTTIGEKDILIILKKE